MYAFIFKIAILNDFEEEQVSLFSKCFNSFFDPKQKLILGVDWLIKYINGNDYKIRTNIWIINKEKRFRFLLSTFLEGTHGILIMCNITRERNTIEIDEWLKDILSNRDEKIPIILVGYIINDEPKIPYEEIRNLAKLHKLDGYAICNLQTGENIDIIFKTLARDLIRRFS